jgi:hypothetical protein
MHVTLVCSILTINGHYSFLTYSQTLVDTACSHTSRQKYLARSTLCRVARCPQGNRVPPPKYPEPTLAELVLDRRRNPNCFRILCFAPPSLSTTASTTSHSLPFPLSLTFTHSLLFSFITTPLRGTLRVLLPTEPARHSCVLSRSLCLAPLHQLWKRPAHLSSPR